MQTQLAASRATTHLLRESDDHRRRLSLLIRYRLNRHSQRAVLPQRCCAGQHVRCDGQPWRTAPVDRRAQLDSASQPSGMGRVADRVAARARTPAGTTTRGPPASSTSHAACSPNSRWRVGDRLRQRIVQHVQDAPPIANCDRRPHPSCRGRSRSRARYQPRASRGERIRPAGVLGACLFTTSVRGCTRYTLAPTTRLVLAGRERGHRALRGPAVET